MINELADYKAEQKKIKIYFGHNLNVSGEILELNPEYIVVKSGDKLIVVSMKHIIYFHEE